MKKFLSIAIAIIMVAGVLFLVGCDKGPADAGTDAPANLKFGLGIAAAYGEVKDASDYRTKYMTYEKWRRRCIRSLIVDLCNEMYPWFEKRGVPMPRKITLGDYKSFWGECFAKRGELKFSYRLFEKDRELIRYVVVHEFAHFIVPNHSAEFWKVVGSVVPDYKELRKRLNGK